MFLIYIDESGKPNYVDTECFTLCALLVNEREWQLLDNQIKMVKVNYLPHLDDEAVEFHAKTLIPGKGVFSSLPPPKRRDVLIDLFQLMKNSNVTVVASVVDKSKLKKQLDVEMWGFRLLFERICWALKMKNAALTAKGQGAEYGLLLIDSVGYDYDKKVRGKLLGLLRQGTMFVPNEYVIEDPLFVSSQYRNLSQMVDLVAWVIRRHFRPSQNYKDQLAADLFPFVEERLHRDGKGQWKGPGIKFFP